MAHWKYLFSNKIVHDKVSIFNNISINNFYSKKIVIIDDKVRPWMTEETKRKIMKTMFRHFRGCSPGREQKDKIIYILQG